MSGSKEVREEEVVVPTTDEYTFFLGVPSDVSLPGISLSCFIRAVPKRRHSFPVKDRPLRTAL